MKEVTIIHDVHEGSPMEMKFKHNTYNPANENEYYNGDNIDMTNCKKKMVGHCQAKINELRKLYGRRFITGNHEAQRDADLLVIIPRTDVGIMHGDFIFWGAEKSMKYRRKDHGAGFLKRGLWVNALEAFENDYDRPVKQEHLDRANLICSSKNLSRLIVGHKHPSKQGDYKLVCGATLTTLPRGINKLWL